MLPIITEIQKQLELCQHAIIANNIAGIKKHADYLQRLLKDALAVPYVAAVLKLKFSDKSTPHLQLSFISKLNELIAEADNTTLNYEKLSTLCTETIAALLATSQQHFSTTEIVKKTDGKYVRSEAVQYLAGIYSVSGSGYSQFYTDFHRGSDVLICVANGSKQSLQLMHAEIKLQLLRDYFSSKLDKTTITTEQDTIRAIISSIDVEKQRVEELAKIIADQHFPDSLAYKLVSQYIEGQFTLFCRHLTTAERIDAEGTAETVFKRACAYQLEQKLLTDYFNGNKGQLLLMLSASHQWNNGATTEVMPFSSESITAVSHEDTVYYAWKCNSEARAWTINSQTVAYQTKIVTAQSLQSSPTAMCAKRSITVTQALDGLVVAASPITFATPSTALEVVAVAADPITIPPEWFQIFYAYLSEDRRGSDDYADIGEKLEQLELDNPQISLAYGLLRQYFNFTDDSSHNSMFVITKRYERAHADRIKNTILEVFKEAAIAHYKSLIPSYNPHGELANRLESTIAEVARSKKLAEAEILMAMLDQQAASQLDDVAPDVDAATTIAISELDDEAAILAKNYYGNQPRQQALQAKIRELKQLRDDVAKANALPVLVKPTKPAEPEKSKKSAIVKSKSHRRLFVKIRNAVKVIAVLAAIGSAALIMAGVVVLPPVLPLVFLVIAAGSVTGVGAWAVCTAVVKAITYAIDKYSDYQNNKPYKTAKAKYDSDMMLYNASKAIYDTTIKANIDIVTELSPKLDTTVTPLADCLRGAKIVTDTRDDKLFIQGELAKVELDEITIRAEVATEEKDAWQEIIRQPPASPEVGRQLDVIARRYQEKIGPILALVQETEPQKRAAIYALYDRFVAATERTTQKPAYKLY